MKTFKQEVILALLSKPEAWMPKFESLEAMAEYLSEDVPATFAGMVDLQAKAIAVIVDLTAWHIDNISNQ
jgi:hypothetical protein